ncbi:MAG: terpene cyclase/mutase family protein [Chloroflexota bacterium]|nr:terpene cyclase/mutase family protein [Chloroflexota bacterium]
MKRQLSILFALLLILLSALPALAQAEVDVSAAVDWLQSQVREDGGFSSDFEEASGVGPTTDSVFAAVSAGADISTWGEEASPLDFLATNASEVDSSGLLAKLILSAVATGQDPTNFGGVNLVERLMEQYNPDTGRFEGIVTDHAYAMLALSAAGEEIPDQARQALIDLQGDQGGWSFDGEGQPDTNTTALAIQALIAADEPVDSTPIVTALAFLRSQQNPNGGFPYQTPSEFGTESDANSTAWVIQALLAADQNLSQWGNPQEFLASLQMENGAFQWQEGVEGSNLLATTQAVPALEEVTFLELPVVQASEEPTVMEEAAPEMEEEAAPETEAPETLPESGGALPWAAIAAVGVILLLGGSVLGRLAVR